MLVIVSQDNKDSAKQVIKQFRMDAWTGLESTDPDENQQYKLEYRPANLPLYLNINVNLTISLFKDQSGIPYLAFTS